MDLLNLLPSDNAAITLKHPVSKNELEGMTISVSGHDSATFKNAIKERAKAQMSRKSADVDFIANDKEAVELLAKCTTGWTGIAKAEKNCHSLQPMPSIFTRNIIGFVSRLIMLLVSVLIFL